MLDTMQVLFEGSKGKLSLTIEGYQFPHIIDHESDSNWLDILGHASLEERNWTFRDPCLMTFEVEYLANWLDEIVAGTAKHDFCGFTEPNLDFKRTADGLVRIGFSLEATPPWAERGADFGEYGFDVPVGAGLTAAADNLRHLLQRFPVRGQRR